MLLTQTSAPAAAPIHSVGVVEAQALIRETNRQMQEARSLCWEDEPAARHAALALVTAFGKALTTLEQLGWPADRIKEALAPAREAFGLASLVKRCQEWPRGYPGDFETIERLAGAANHSEPGTLGWHFERLLLKSPVAQQHRNKLAHQTTEIARTVLRNRDARVLSVACGGCLDWAPILPLLSDFTGEIVLNDYEPAALELAESRIRTATARYRLAPGNVLRVARRFAGEPAFHLAVAGGLFDYLSDKAIVFLLRSIYALLAPGGILLFTNIAQGNAWRPLMEYGSDWPLIERTEQQLTSLCLEAGIGRSEIAVTREETGLTLLTRVVRRG